MNKLISGYRYPGGPLDTSTAPYFYKALSSLL